MLRTPELGTPQGGVVSPLLANIYLNPLDHLMMDQGYELLRYADDFVIPCRCCNEAEAAWKRSGNGCGRRIWSCIRIRPRLWIPVNPAASISWLPPRKGAPLAPR